MDYLPGVPWVPGGRAARRSLGALLLYTVAGTYAITAATAAPLPQTPDPLPGSTFQGADGDHDDAPSLDLVDWQTLEARGLVNHSADPNADDNAFVGGSKENEPGEWELTTESGGVSPGKDNIRDAWSTVDQPRGNTFLYLGFARESADGTSYVAFELNHDARLWDNGRARIPCRRPGDVLIAYRAQGNEVEVVIQRWITTITDPATGCARTGRLEEYTRFTPNVDVQGAVNGAAITSWLPGAYTDTVPVGRFGEAALNLAELLDDAFGDDCLSFRSIWMHSRSSTSEQSNMQDYVAPQQLNVRTCSASGVKFFDRDADGVRDRDDPGIPLFLIFADYDDDGRLDRGEPRTLSDRRGRWVLHDIRPPDGTYRVRETLLRRHLPPLADWICSYPSDSTTGGTGSATPGRFPCAWGPLDVALDQHARGLDFGNWFPARLTLEKEIEPAGDPGRFDLLVNGEVVLPAAGDGDSITISVPPGTYTVSEVPAGATPGGEYRSTVECRRTPSRRGRAAGGTVYEGLDLFAGNRATCTFRNIRPGVPAIAIRKIGPALADAGDTLGYTFYVTNPGDVGFPAAGVVVSDPKCDDPPELVEKRADSGEDESPQTLDPGDTWVYRCENSTAEPGADCEPYSVDNTGMVTARTDTATVEDEDSMSTIVVCPDSPRPPEPPRPNGGGPEPGPVAPVGPSPPRAGVAAVARARFRQATEGCIANRVPRVTFRGTRIRRIRIFVNGRLRRNLTVRSLQRRITPRVTLGPGRYRVTARVTFEPGAGTPPVTLSRVIRICAAARPRFTG
jgi:hypothetical protein